MIWEFIFFSLRTIEKEIVLTADIIADFREFLFNHFGDKGAK